MPEAAAQSPTCPRCGRTQRVDSRYCDACGQSLNGAGEAAVPVVLEAKVKPTTYMVDLTTNRASPCYLSAATKCPQCGAKAIVALEECIEKQQLRSAKTAEHRGELWEVRAYRRYRCEACQKDAFVFLQDAQALREEHRPSRTGYWNDSQPLVRIYRGTCQVCRKHEMDATCGNCSKMACENDFARRHGRCVPCAPKCAACGRVSYKPCKTCKRQVCKAHGKNLYWIAGWRCADDYVRENQLR